MKNKVFRICRKAGNIDSNLITTAYTLAATYYLYNLLFAGVPDVDPMFLFGMLVGLMGFSFLLVTVVNAVVFSLLSVVTNIFFKAELVQDRAEEKYFFEYIKYGITFMPADRQEHYFHLVNDAMEYDHSGDN